VFQVYTCKSLK